MKKIFGKSKKDAPVARRRISDSVQPNSVSEGTATYDRYSFRRNRTLTGSLSSGVASAGEHRAELKSSRVQHHELRRHRRKLLGVLAATFLAIGVLGFLIYQSIVEIKVGSVGTTSVIDSELYEQKIQDYLSERPLERFRFSFNKNGLIDYLEQNDAPEAGSVAGELGFGGFGVTDITLEFRRPAVVWNTGSSRLYVDKSGNAFRRNYFDEPMVSVIDKSGVQAQNNQVIASSRFLAFMGKIIGQIQANGFEVSEISLPADTTRQIELRIAGISYPVKLSTDRPAGEQAEDAARAVRYLSANGIGAAYLDVRVSGKAYYK
jgi:hypothetical protein